MNLSVSRLNSANTNSSIGILYICIKLYASITLLAVALGLINMLLRLLLIICSKIACCCRSEIKLTNKLSVSA